MIALKIETLKNRLPALSLRDAIAWCAGTLLLLIAVLIANALRFDSRGPPPFYLLLELHGKFIAGLTKAGQRYGTGRCGRQPVEEQGSRKCGGGLA